MIGSAYRGHARQRGAAVCALSLFKGLTTVKIMSAATLTRLRKIDGLIKAISECIAMHEVHIVLPPAYCSDFKSYVQGEREAISTLSAEKERLLDERNALLAQSEFAFA